MAKYCAECWKYINKRKKLPDYYTNSFYVGVCDRCYKWKGIVTEKQNFINQCIPRMERHGYYLIVAIYFLFDGLIKILFRYIKKRRHYWYCKRQCIYRGWKFRQTLFQVLLRRRKMALFGIYDRNKTLEVSNDE
jgi:hypothetical protein